MNIGKCEQTNLPRRKMHIKNYQLAATWLVYRWQSLAPARQTNFGLPGKFIILDPKIDYR